MAHHHITVADEQYIFQPATKRLLYILLGAGVLVFLLGVLFPGGGEHHAEAEGHGKASAAASHQMVASAEHGAAASDGHAQHSGHEAAAAEHGEHAGGHHGPTLLTRIKTTLWANNIYFVGLGIIGLFFVAIQYAAQAGWSAGILRIPLSMAHWLPFAFVLTLGLWFWTSHDIFHWTHAGLYEKDGAEFDKIINKKGPFFFWPLASGTFPLFYIARMVIFFTGWYLFFVRIKKNMLAEDLESTTSYWYKNRVTSAWFLIFFAVSSSIAAWDWVMSIDTHWFSTMFGWYMFASWWVTALAVMTLIVANLKGAGYLKIINANHLHDLGKFVFAFSIFWTYIWFGQFLLIYYANIPEESVYFVERMMTAPYSWIFFVNLIMNFVLPFLLFMTRDAKRQISMLKLVCPIVIIGHWFDFYNMVTPGVMQTHGTLGFLEIGTGLIFMAVYLLVVLSSLAKMPLIGKNHPMLEESLGHHI